MYQAFLSGLLAVLVSASLWLGFPASAAAGGNAAIAALPGFKEIFGGSRPTTLGVKEDHLAPCPSSPNCVVSQGTPDAQHAIAPLTYTSDATEAMTTLKQVIAAQPGSEIIEQTDTYLYAEFTSNLMGFVDDVEFFFPPTEPGIIHVRSASRLGESDLGVNRKRIEAIRAAFQV